MRDLFKRLLIVSSFLILPLASYASSASLALVPREGSFEAGQLIKAKIVLVNSGGALVNTIGTSLVFPAELLTLVSVSKDGSALGLWAEEPSIKAGKVSFAGGSTNPITANSSRILTLSFRANKTGQATFSFEGTSILIADGLGTDITSQPETIAWKIVPFQKILKPKPAVSTSTPLVNKIESSEPELAVETGAPGVSFENGASLLSISLALNILLLIFVFTYILRGFFCKKCGK